MLPIELNDSFITLIPKIVNPQHLHKFWPISLVGCVYKVIAKILSLRLKKVLNKVLDHKQLMLLEGRGLVDSALVANETLKEIKRKK